MAAAEKVKNFIHRRKRRYMAQLLEAFEEDVQRYLPDDVAQNFKALVRRKMNALAVDAVDMIDQDGKGFVQNGAAQQMLDQIHPDSTRPTADAAGR